MTTRITRTPVADEGAITPSALLSHADDPTEAAQSVRNVLSFMSMVLLDGVDFGGNTSAMEGAGLILETCAATLDAHFGDQAGGAA